MPAGMPLAPGVRRRAAARSRRCWPGTRTSPPGKRLQAIRPADPGFAVGAASLPHRHRLLPGRSHHRDRRRHPGRHRHRGADAPPTTPVDAAHRLLAAHIDGMAEETTRRARSSRSRVNCRCSPCPGSCPNPHPPTDARGPAGRPTAGDAAPPPDPHDHPRTSDAAADPSAVHRPGDHRARPALDDIIEAGFILTTTDLTVVAELQLLVRPIPAAMRRLLADDTLLRMHGANGLLTALGVTTAGHPTRSPTDVRAGGRRGTTRARPAP